jgi:hypothetical protein
MMFSMKTTTTARYSDGFSKFEGKGWKKVIVTADHVTDAKAGIKLVKEWVKANGGKAKLDTFFSAPRWSSNLDLFYRAEIFYTVAA